MLWLMMMMTTDFFFIFRMIKMIALNNNNNDDKTREEGERRLEERQIGRVQGEGERKKGEDNKTDWKNLYRHT